MANPKLTHDQLTAANEILDELRSRMREAAGDDDDMYWALRRKVAKELIYDERGKPAHRQRLKVKKMKEQDSKCTICGEDLPEKGAVPDRYEAIKGYTVENTRLVHLRCDRAEQEGLGYAEP